MEQSEKWQVVASGAIVEGKARGQVVEALKQRFQFDDAKIERLLNGRQKVVKKGLDQTSAYSFKQTLLAVGVEVGTQPMPREGDAGLSSGLSLESIVGDEAHGGGGDDLAEGKPPAPVVAPGHMRCPRCQSIQPKAAECASCGVFVERYRRLAAGVKETPSADMGREGSLRLGTLAGYGGIIGILLLAFLLFSSPDSLPVGTTPEAMAQADALRKAKGHPRPDLTYLKELLEYGISPDWLNQRAFCLAQDGEYEQALADINRTLDYYPKNAYALELKPWLQQQL